MQKILIFIFIGLLFGVNSCKEDKDLFLYDGPNYVSFIDAASDYTAIGGEENVFPLEVGVTTADASKTYTIEIDTDASTGIEGTHFTLDSKEVSIASGEYVGTANITPIFEALPDDGISITFNLVNLADTADFTIRTHTMVIGKFCAVEDFSGNYTGTHGAHASTVVIESTGIANEYRVYGLAEFVPRDWGENWIAGDGSSVMSFKCANVASIPDQWIGDTDYPDTYFIYDATGAYDEDANTLSLTYSITYAGEITTVLTRDGKSTTQVEPFTVKK